MLKNALIINYPSSKQDFRLPIVKYYLGKFYSIDICINPLWGNYKTKVEIAKNPLYIFKYIFKEIGYLIKLIYIIFRNNYDLIIIGYPAYFEALFLKIFISKKIRKNIYIDFFISIYDTLVLDRESITPKSLKAKILFYFDKKLGKSYTKLLVDTQKNADRFAQMFNINKNNFLVLFVGSNNLILNRLFEYKKNKNGHLHIGWTGAIIPLHGINEIIKCAEIVKGENIEFHLVGNGPNNELEQINILIDTLGLKNIILYGELDFEKTMEILGNCDICLGIFGTSDKAKSVIPFKVFDYLYLNKPIITQNSDAIMEISEFSQVYKVANNASAIAKKIHEVDINCSFNSRDLLMKILKDQYNKVFSVG